MGSDSLDWHWVTSLDRMTPTTPLREIASIAGALGPILDDAGVKADVGEDDFSKYQAVGIVCGDAHLILATREGYADTQIDVFGDPAARERDMEIVRRVFDSLGVPMHELPMVV